MQKYASRKAIGAGEFGTIVVSATYDSFPVPVYMHYLALYYTNFDLALDSAEKTIGNGASLGRIYFLGLSGQYFEFVNGKDKILINCKTLAIKTPEEILTVSAKEIQVPSGMNAQLDIKEDVEAAWKTIESEFEKR